MPTTINGIFIQDQAASTFTGATTTPTGTSALTITRLDAYLTGSGAGSGEVFAYDKATKKLFVMNNVTDKIEVIDITDPSNMVKLSEIDVSTIANYDGMNSLAVANGVLAVAVQHSTKAEPGKVALYSTANSALLNTLTVGALPDMLTFTPDGKKIVVANEGENDTLPAVDAAGTISVIDLTTGAATATATVQTVGFATLDTNEAALRAAGVRIAAGVSASIFFEPEYIDLSADGKTAYVTLQEANAVAVFDISPTVPVLKSILPLGYIDHNLAGNEGDFSDRDAIGSAAGAISINTAQIRGMPMPDSIATWTFGGVTYFATANEGDARVDETDQARLSTLNLNDTVFGANEAILKNEDEAGRLTVSAVDGDTDTGTPGLEAIYAFGGRGFSVFRVNNTDGTIQKVDESGGEFEDIIAALPNAATVFNGENNAAFDSRSDNKAAEPEGVDVANVGGSFYAFISLERAGGFMVYDVTDADDIAFVSYIPATAEDFAPEVIKYIDPVDSPTGKGLLLTANEVSGSVTAYEVVPENFTLQLLHLSDGEAGLLAPQTAPNLAALVDAFDDAFANTLILSGGDNFLPGPFIAGGTDLSVTATLNAVTGSTIGVGVNIPVAAVDIAILNSIGVEASTIGNHEFDLGSRVLRDAFSPNLGAPGWVGAQFPYMSANLDFSGDGDLNPRFTNTLDGGTTALIPEASTLKGRIAPSAVFVKGGEKIGLVAATTQLIESISSPTGTEVKGFPPGPGANGEVDNMDLLAAQLQPVIDELIAEGVNKIILQSHLQQIANEQLLATKLHGVDIILAAGSNTRLSDADDDLVAFPGHEATSEGPYPIVTQGTDGKTTLIVNTDGEYTYLGRLVVDFDTNGEIIVQSLTDNLALNGAHASTEANVADAWGTTVGNLATTAFADGTKGDKVEKLADAVGAVINSKDSNVFGYTEVYLEGERGIIRNQETNLGDLSADANAWVAQQALGGVPFMASLKNGGGVRAQIGTVSDPDPVTGEIDKLPPPANPDANKPEGGVSQLDIENSLRFNNRLMVYDATPQGLLNILNWGAGLSANNGGFPQIGGVKYSYDPDLPGNSGATPGSRIRDVALIDADGNVVALVVDDGVVLPDAPAVISVVTLNFTANGGDSYPVKANGSNFRYLLADGTVSAPVDEALDFTATVNVPATVLGEQEALAEFMAAFHSTPATAYDQADVPQTQDLRIQNLNVRADAVFDSPAQNGGDAAEAFTGTAGNDTIKGAGGDDTVLGNGGADTAAFGSARAQYDVRSVLIGNLLHTLVEHAGGSNADGTDTLAGVEMLEFADHGFHLNGAQLNHAANVAGSRFDDVVLQNTITGQVIFAEMVDGVRQGFDAVTAPLATDWKAVSSGNVDPGPNGGAEVFIQQQSTGTIYYASLDTGQLAYGVVAVGLTPDWDLVASADVTGDGSVDVIVQQASTGTIYFADMAGGTFHGWGVVTIGLTPEWTAIGAGDVTGDGFADVVVQNETTGQTVFAAMDDGGFQAWGPVASGLPFAWAAKGVGDVTGDGVDDVVFQHTGTRQIIYADVAGGGIGDIGTVPGWNVEGIADVDNDGFDDVIIRDQTSGQVAYANMGPAGFEGFLGAAENIGPNWDVV